MLGREQSYADAILEAENKVGQTPLPGYETFEIVDGEKVEVVAFTNPKQEEVDQYETPFFYAAYDLWLSTKRWNLPNGTIGWGNERNTVIEILNILESEKNRYDAWEFEQNKPKG